MRISDWSSDVCSSDLKPIIYGGIAARIAGVGRFFAMVSGLGYVFTDDGGKPRRRLQRLVAALYRTGVSRAGAVFVFNRDDRAEMLRHGIFRSDQNVVPVPGSGIDPRRFQRSSVTQGAPVFPTRKRAVA